MPNQAQSSNAKKYDLEERTAQFGENVIRFMQNLPDTPVNKPLKSQVVRAATSVGANYMEADAAGSKRDFEHKIGLCKKEAKETMHWIRMVAVANKERSEECRKLWREAHELALIFSSILSNSKQSTKKKF